MTKKQSLNNKRIITRTLDDSDHEDDQLINGTSQMDFQPILGSLEISNMNSSTSNMDDSNDMDIGDEITVEDSSTDQVVISRRLTSKVWLYATKLDATAQAACDLCEFKCSCHSHSTSTIRQHLISKHKKTDLIVKSSSRSSKSKISEALKNELHQLCYSAIVKDSRSFNDLNKTGIKALLNKLCPGYSPPHRNQVSRQLDVLYQHHYNLLKDELKQVHALSVTLDFWSDRRCQSFLCITGHWITDTWKSISKIIDFSCYNSRHTAVEISTTLKDKFIALGIYEKIICITCDGAENMKLACQYLDENIPRIWCCAHRLHLAVINGLGFWIPKEKLKSMSDQSLSASSTTNNRITTTANDSTIGKNNMNIDWDDELSNESWSNNLSSSTNAKNRLPSCLNNDTTNESAADDQTYTMSDDDNDEDDDCNNNSTEDNWTTGYEDYTNSTEQQIWIMNLLIKCRSIAKLTKKSSIISDYLRKQCKPSDKKPTIKNDCKTRWNSSYSLCESLVTSKHLIMKLFMEKTSLTLRKDQINKLSAIELQSDDWDLLNSLYIVLTSSFRATQMMSGRRYPTIGLAYCMISKIKSYCMKDDSDEYIRIIKRLLIRTLNKYFYEDTEQLEYFQRFSFFDPCAHLCFSDKEKRQIENYAKKVFLDDIYPISSQTTNNTSSSVPSSNSTQSKQSTQPARSKSTLYERFLLSCNDDEVSFVGCGKEKSKRIAINDEIKQFALLVDQFNAKVLPSADSAFAFWRINKDRLPILSHLAKIHLVACASSVPKRIYHIQFF
ncbi:unnamed protein product [Adineta ricciae]|uniref:BED-type domain-containing protein n=1 Tax=Adineta ricciae TaxID=249248 RepID=A0A814USK8_ADIRI|nr:unnamed protein product [Adineta ricciae]